MQSLKEVIEISNSDIILLTETKGRPCRIENIKWFSKERGKDKGGGIAIGVKNNLAKYASIEKEKEEDYTESLWVKIELPGKKADMIGVFYGKQESTRKEEVERQFNDLTTQIEKVKKEGSVIIVGDFNAKLEWNEGKERVQTYSRNGKIMKEMIEVTETKVVNDMSKTGKWTRQNRNNKDERSIIDYVVVCNSMEKRVKEVEIDEGGGYRIKNEKHETDHNTMIITIEEPEWREKKTTIKMWNIKNEEGWKEFDRILGDILESKEVQTYQELSNIIRKTLVKTVGKQTITVGKKQKERE